MSLGVLIKSLRRDKLLIPLLKEHLAKEAELISKGKRSHKDTVQTDAQQTIACFKERLKEYNHRQKIDGDYFHPSQLGACLRAMFFDVKGAPRDGMTTRDELLRSHLIFEFGTYAHVLFQNLCERAGVLTSREIAIVDPINRHLGHADGKLRISGIDYLLEIKTINSRGFSSLKEPKEAHKMQMMAYMKSLKLQWGIIIYMDKDTSRLCEFTVAYSDYYYQQKVAPRIDRYFKGLSKNWIPDREGDSPLLLFFQEAMLR